LIIMGQTVRRNGLLTCIDEDTMSPWRLRP
jgi:hypothetical protein